MSYLRGLFENLMEGGEEAASTAMALKVTGEQGGREARWQTDRQTDRPGVSADTGTWGSDTHTDTGGRSFQASVVFC